MIQVAIAIATSDLKLNLALLKATSAVRRITVQEKERQKQQLFYNLLQQDAASRVGLQAKLLGWF